MSVLVEDCVSGEFQVFVKGAPEKLLANCINIRAQISEKSVRNYMRVIKSLSMEGLRTIAFGCKTISSQSL